jgi:hypothetical protein
MSTYNKYYNAQLEKGQEYQDFVTERLYEIGLPIISYSSKKFQHTVGENKCGFEIKFDDKLKSTGNLYIEISEKSNPDNPNYIASGIYRNDNTWLYIIGDYSIIYIFSKKQLRKVYETKKGFFREIKIPTSNGFLVPAKYAEEVLAIKILQLDTKGES